MNALQARMRNHDLTPFAINRLMTRHKELVEDSIDADIVDPCGNGTVPRPFRTEIINELVTDETHYAFTAVIDSIDTMLPPIEPEESVRSMVGTEDRIETYVARYAAGEQLFHASDSNPTIGTGDWQ